MAILAGTTKNIGFQIFKTLYINVGVRLTESGLTESGLTETWIIRNKNKSIKL